MNQKFKAYQKQRLNIQLNQISNSLPNNFLQETKFKCIDLAKFIKQQMPKQDYFKTVQKATLRKMDLLDVTGLVGLKNDLVKALTELFEIQRQLRYKKQKYQARKQIMQQEDFSEPISKKKIQSVIQSPRNTTSPGMQDLFRSMVTTPHKQQVTLPSKPANKNLQIPLYRAKNQSNENKLDRISKYIGSLKRNIKLNSQAIGYKWKIKEFLLEDPNYLKIISQIQKYQMREEQLDHIFSKAVQKGIRGCLEKSQIVETNSEYKLVKIYKPNKKAQKTDDLNLLKSKSMNFNSPYNMKSKQSRLHISYAPQPFISPPRQPPTTFTSPLRNLSSKADIENKALQDFNSIKKELQKSTQSYMEMITKINETVEKGSEKLIMMREKRKKKFEKDQDIWDELDKI